MSGTYDISEGLVIILIKMQHCNISHPQNHEMLGLFCGRILLQTGATFLIGVENENSIPKLSETSGWWLAAYP